MPALDIGMKHRNSSGLKELQPQPLQQGHRSSTHVDIASSVHGQAAI